jgi:hypothetical protein
VDGLLRTLFGSFCDEREAEVRAMIAFSVWIGSHLIAADHGTRDPEEAWELVWDRLRSSPRRR